MGLLLDVLGARPRNTQQIEAARPQLDTTVRQTLARLLKVSTLALGTTGKITGRTEFEPSPYNFDRLIQAVDTDSYLKQGLMKYKELMWKEGWHISGENSEAVDYLYMRIDFMEAAIGRPFQSLLEEVGDQVVKFANCFLVKSRGDLNPYFPGRTIRGYEDQEPIIGYYLIPTETVEIKRNKNNKPLSYRQRTHEAGTWTWSNQESYMGPKWKPEEVIHFYVDRKPGRAYGTPFLTATLDDVIALRQLEEDIENLVHKEIFPLYVYTVGTETHPADPDEITAAARELDTLRTEGGLVVPERHTVEVLGADGTALEADPYLQHFKERVCVGIGLAPHHLGMMMNGGNRSVTDRLDVALYDKIKLYQRYLAATIRLNILNEMLVEGGFDVLQDRCEFIFDEIDVDTQVKKEAHELNKYTNNVQDIEETRMKLGRKPELNDDRTLEAIKSAHSIDQIRAQVEVANVKKAQNAAKSGTPSKPGAAKPSTGGTRNSPNSGRRTQNRVTPSNQHGTRSSPAIRRDDDSPQYVFEDVLEILDKETEE